MIVNTGWLLDYLSPKIPLEDLLTALPRVGLDVEAAQVLARELALVRVGFVRAKRPLEGTTDKFVLDVEVARGDVRQIVCASAHPIETDWGVPVALAGIQLPTGITIHEEHFHGVLSQGMVCLDGEMGMTANGTGLQVFRDEAVLGKPLPEAMAITEALVHMKVYPNRPDCLGLVGIAREIAALLGLKLTLPEIPLPVIAASGAAVPVTIQDRMGCTRYTCQVISGVKVENSAPWMASRLLATGSRPINNVVDITNFVMKEWGQPLHAFDLQNVRKKIIVRRFKKGESLRLLDGRTISGAEEVNPLAIADARSPMALAGIMGGEFSGIAEETADVLLEAAHFEPTNIRLTSRRLGVSSDSSYRFERGTDPNETLEAARNRASALLFSEAGAKSAGPVIDVYPKRAKRAVFALSAERVSGYLGIPVTREQVHASLTALGYECSENLKRIHVPTRRVDATDPVVLIEDVARVIGYEAILPRAAAETPTAGRTSPLDTARAAARAGLAGSGFLELRGVPLEPLEGEAEFSQLPGAPVVLQNPLNTDLARVRRSLVPFLVKTAALNARRRATTFRYFEIDKIFSRPEEDPAKEPVEHWALGILLGGAATDADWSTRREADFFDLKGTVESILESLRVPRAMFEPTEIEGYLAGTAARVMIGGESVGVIGQIAPEHLASRKILNAGFAAELFLGKLVAAALPTARYEPLPRFPGVFRDLSFIVKKDISYAAIEDAIRAAAGPHLETVDCIDVFAGKGIAEDSRSMAVSMAFRAPDRTLASEEVAAAVEQVIAHLAKSLGAELRG